MIKSVSRACTFFSIALLLFLGCKKEDAQANIQCTIADSTFNEGSTQLAKFRLIEAIPHNDDNTISIQAYASETGNGGIALGMDFSGQTLPAPGVYTAMTQVYNRAVRPGEIYLSYMGTGMYSLWSPKDTFKVSITEKDGLLHIQFCDAAFGEAFSSIVHNCSASITIRK